jgi:hypothetical protein
VTAEECESERRPEETSFSVTRHSSVTVYLKIGLGVDLLVIFQSPHCWSLYFKPDDEYK